MERSGEGDGRDYMIGQARFTARPPAPGLYLVATPIGNLGDITIRALETLAAADIVACEDTRVTRVLLDRFGIRRRTTAYHEHNEAEAGARLLAAVVEGGSVALVSDAGTPLVSDPGYRLVGAVLDAGHRVFPIPGPSAAVAALTASGLPTDSFLFAGFLASRDGQRRSRLEELHSVPASLVFYESPRRLADSLQAMADVFGASRPGAVLREITKSYEETRRGTLGELASHYAESGAPKGEVVVCIGPPVQVEARPVDVDALLLGLASEMPASKASAEAARMTGMSKSDLYKRLLTLKGHGQ